MGRPRALLLGVFLLFGSLQLSSAAPVSQGVRILADYPLPAGLSAPVDIRWASERSVFLARLQEGVFELELGEPLVQVRQPVPAPEILKLGSLRTYAHLAVTPQNLLIASGMSSFAWRPMSDRRGGEVVFQGGEFASLHDVDLRGGQILILGLREQTPRNRDGGVVWLGNLGEQKESFRLLLRDDNVELDPDTWLSSRCGVVPLGTARFLSDGSFLVVPGFQPGIYLFSREGALVRRWSSQDLGVTAECSKVPFGALMRPQAFPHWLAKQRAVDDILPLSQGPGLLIRSVGRDGQVHWDLTVLGAGGVSTYPLPLKATRPTDRLHGDVREGKIVLLMATGELWPQERSNYSGRVIVAELVP